MKMVLDQYAQLDFHSAKSLKPQSLCRHVAPLEHINYPDLELACLCSYSLMLHYSWRSSKFQFFGFWFGLIRSRSTALKASTLTINTTNVILKKG